MNAPGDTVLIFLLLALFVACCAYAAGRVHQRYQLKRDRDEAYREGYETASNRVFSLAVRSAVPKKETASPSPASPSEPDTDPGRAIRHQGVAGPAPAPAVSERTEKPGFPAPPPPPRHTVAEPPAVGGVTYQQFPDPRTADDATVVTPRTHATDDAVVTPRTRTTDDATVITPRAHATDDATTVTPRARSGGKHTVPDELVQAATYRLPADRVFRAKVPNSTPLPDEPTTNLPVPKPRRP
ncbi:hypothetical protein KOI35_04100 [Actinoplanes bogorensis]|uniref:Uncharacterized protein n=1 Tax=Paractinoplanes bogorensis TaxID=1610840 RepID=A0ABS5YGY3_9ACTN|nr:hypothetical protein [Actinoplanes bogorensis]MBU2662681.1 hypothetical protein [Actinoplanes bogorensis]